MRKLGLKVVCDKRDTTNIFKGITAKVIEKVSYSNPHIGLKAYFMDAYLNVNGFLSKVL